MSSHATACPSCGYPLAAPTDPVAPKAPAPAHASAKTQSATLGYIAAALIAAGAFAPVLTAPIVGGRSLFGNGDGDGLFVLIGAALLAVAAFARASFTALAITILLAIVLYVDYAGMRGRLVALEGNPYADAAQLGWGWLLLFAGVLLGVIAALRGLDARRAKRAEPNDSPAAQHSA